MLAHVTELRGQMQETRIFEAAEEIQVEYTARLVPKPAPARSRRKHVAGCGCAPGTLLCPH
jgi:hypothetical protein